METQYSLVKNLNTNSKEKEKIVKIFIIDDDLNYCKALEFRLKSRPQYKVYIFKTGEECFKQFRSQQPDLIILDYYLNHSVPTAMNGLEILKRLKKINPETAVMMLSGREDLSVAVNCVKYGASDYVVKGQKTFLHLQERICKILDNAQLQRKMKKQELFGKIIVLASVLTLSLPIIMLYLVPGFSYVISMIMLAGLFTAFVVIGRMVFDQQSAPRMKPITYSTATNSKGAGF